MGLRLFPTLTTSDRTVKADLIEKLAQPPQLVVLGSSRSMRYEPAYLQQKTGLRAFNAGLNGIGGTADTWAVTNYIHDTFPDARPAYFWLIDVESFVPFAIQGRTADEPRLARTSRDQADPAHSGSRRAYSGASNALRRSDEASGTTARRCSRGSLPSTRCGC